MNTQQEELIEKIRIFELDIDHFELNIHDEFMSVERALRSIVHFISTQVIDTDPSMECKSHLVISFILLIHSGFFF